MNTEEQNEREAMFLAVINSMRHDFPNSAMSRMSDEQAAMTAESWSELLSEIPARRILNVYKSVASTVENPPAPKHIKDAWTKIAIREGEKYENDKRQREDAELKANHDAGFGAIGFKVFQMSHQRQHAGLDAVCCDCETKEGEGVVAGLTKDQEYFRCELGQCYFREPVSKLMEIRTHPKWNPMIGGIMQSGTSNLQKEFIAPVTPLAVKNGTLLDDAEIIENLESRCQMEPSKIAQEKLLEFGRFLLKQEPILVRWNNELAREKWQEFKQEAA